MTEKSQISPLRRALSSCRQQLIAVGVFSFCLNVLYIAPTIYMLQVYDRVVPTHGGWTLAMLTVVLVATLGTLSGLDLLRGRILVRIGDRLDRTVAPAIVDSLIRRGEAGAKCQPLRDFDMLRGVIGGSGTLALLDAPWMPVYVLLAWLIHPLLGVLALVGAGVLVAIALANERAVSRQLRQAHGASARSYARLDRVLGASTTVRAMRMGHGLSDRLLADREQAQGLIRSSSLASTHYLSATRFARQLLQSLALGAGALLAINGDITAGAIFAASLLVTRALAPVELLVGNLRNLVQARAAWKDLDAFLATSTPIDKTLLPPTGGSLAAEAITLRRGGDAPAILDSVSLALAPGEVLGIVGPSGAGKSTLAQVLAGAIRPSSGCVRLDGADIREWDDEQFGASVGYAAQQPELLAGTIKDNISRFDPVALLDPAALDSDVVAAATMCGAHQMILSLPQGYNTQVDSEGAGLSSGQAARIALARAFFRCPQVLILDEPNASLDAAGEAALIASLLDLKDRGVTQVIVAHRPQVLAAADKILVLKEGRVVLYGSSRDVLATMAAQTAPVAQGEVR